MNKPELTPEQLLKIAARLQGYLEHFNITDIFGNDMNVMTVVEPKKFVDKSAVYDAIAKKMEAFDFVTVKQPDTFVNADGFEEDIKKTFVFATNGDMPDQLSKIDKKLQAYGYPTLTMLDFIKHTLSEPKFDPNDGTTVGYNQFTIIRRPEKSYEFAVMGALNELERSGGVTWENFEEGLKPDI